MTTTMAAISSLSFFQLAGICIIILMVATAIFSSISAGNQLNEIIERIEGVRKALHLLHQERSALSIAAHDAQMSQAQTKELSPLSPLEPLEDALAPSQAQQEGRGLIFVTAPIDGITEAGKPAESFLKFMSKLRREFPDLTLISPFLHDHLLWPQEDRTSANALLLERRMERLMKASDEVWLFQYFGWQDSVAVQAELAMASRLGKSVRHFSPGSIIHMQDGGLAPTGGS